MIKKFEIVVLDEMDILIDEFYNDLKMINNEEQIKKNINLIKSGNIRKKKDNVNLEVKNKSFNINYLSNTQLIGFSATLPSKMNDFFSNPVIVREKEGLSDNLVSFFFYVRDNKDQFLLFLLMKVESALIFVSNRYTAQYLEELINRANILKGRGSKENKGNKVGDDNNDININNYKNDINNDINKQYTAQSLYSSLDDQSRSVIYNNFKCKKTKFLIVTDIAARGLHLQNLEILVNYDMADEKVFLHRVGRVGRNKKGAVFSLVTSLDVHHYVDIKATYYENKDCHLFDSPYYKSKRLLNSNCDDLESIRECGIRAYKKSIKFRKNVFSQADSSLLINDLKEFNFDVLNDIFNKTDFVKEKGGERNNLLENIRNYRQFGSEDSKVQQKEEFKAQKEKIECQKEKFKDQFYIPYRSKKSKLIHSSVYSVQKD
ncbi:DEAD-box ATP-dependent RNA helicase 29 [Dictyocoela muelleri]|nr:DEAD-box ATP-dependent RNA helicase 29 [Dictyocoela muelleri]